MQSCIWSIYTNIQMFDMSDLWWWARCSLGRILLFACVFCKISGYFLQGINGLLLSFILIEFPPVGAFTR